MDVEVLHENASGRLARIGDVYVQVRWGVLTIAALDRMLEVFLAARAKTTGAIHALMIIEPGADVPTADVRARQKEILRAIAESGPFMGIVVIEGQGLLAHLARENMATIAPETPCASDVEEAVRMLERERRTSDVREIVTAVESVRRR